jgi:hypothetical protein
MDDKWKIIIIIALILIGFAAIFIGGLVSIALLGFFPDKASDAMMAQSASYWRGGARPFAVLDHNIAQDGSGSITVQNMDSDGTLKMTRLKIEEKEIPLSLLVLPGEIKEVGVSGLAKGGTGERYNFLIEISYKTSSGAAQTQIGAKPLVGKYA